MKIKFILIFVLSVIISYLMMSLVCLTFDITQWDYTMRFIFVFFPIITAAVLFIIYFDRNMVFVNKVRLKYYLGEVYDHGANRILACGKLSEIQTQKEAQYYCEVSKEMKIEEIVKKF